MKNISIIFLLLLLGFTSLAQDLSKSVEYKDTGWKRSIQQRLATASHDTSRVLLMVEMSSYYKFKRPDSALFYGYKALELARLIKFPKGEVRAMSTIVLAQLTLGNDSKSLQTNLQASKIAEKHNLIFDRAVLQLNLGVIHNRSQSYAKALSLFRESMRFFDTVHSLNFSTLTQSKIGETYLMLNQPDSALYSSQIAHKNALRLNVSWVSHEVLLTLGKIHAKIGNPDLALAYFQQSLPVAVEADMIFRSNFSIAQLYQQIDDADSCIHYATKSLEIANESGIYTNIINASVLLSGINEEHDARKALQYNKMAIAFKDSLYNLGKAAAMETFIDFDEKERQYEIETAKTEFQNRIRMNAFLGSSFTLIVIAIFLFRNNRMKQKAKQKIEKAYDQLKSTQSQLIQSEKMASLGELTAGIAHEIQNPLNFINNFSEVNAELIDELEKEIDEGKIVDVKAIAIDIKENEQKINHHGKRAESIVKGMLQHSRTTTGQKEPTDINALADEYLRLAYHGLRAKDKSFNADFKTEFDKNIPKLNIIPQDIGRVLLNLINNAFYAVSSKASHPSPEVSTVEGVTENGDYSPQVNVSTRRVDSSSGVGGNAGQSIEIRIQDNGDGIPENIKEKIFQPFFTTKPTGSGTGLGLSLSYDIIRAHGGEIKVETIEGEGSEFIIWIPFNL